MGHAQFRTALQAHNLLDFLLLAELIARKMKFGFLRDLSDQVSFYAQYAEGFRAPDFQSANLSFTNLAFR